ncbi:MAG: PIN domain-containing protein [Hyphomicrobium sp.]
MNFVSLALVIDHETSGDLPRIVEIMSKYADLPADFADASLISMCERRNIAHIATFDKDFDVYVLGNGRTLQNVFRDGA